MIVFVTTVDQDLCPVVRDYTRKTLNSWIRKIAGNKKYTVRDTDDQTLYFLIGYHKDLKFVAMGDKVEQELKEMFVDCFKLPNPSPRNAFLKNKTQVDAVVEECVKWLQK